MVRDALMLALACVAMAASAVASAQLVVSEKEVRREARVEWLSMKRHLSVVKDPRITNYVQCVADAIIATLTPAQAQAEWEVVVSTKTRSMRLQTRTTRSGYLRGFCA